MSTPADPNPPAPDAPTPPPQAPSAGPPPGWGPAPGWQSAPGQGQVGPAGGWQAGPWQGGAPDGGPTSSEDTTWALLAHLSFFVLGLLGPLIIYLVKKDTSPFVRQHAAEALNFHITVTIAAIVSAVLIIVLIGIVLLLAVLVGGAVLAVMAAIAANKGQPYRYPLTLRLVS